MAGFFMKFYLFLPCLVIILLDLLFLLNKLVQTNFFSYECFGRDI